MISQACWSENGASQEGESPFIRPVDVVFQLVSSCLTDSGHHVQVCYGRLPVDDRLIVLPQFLILLTSVSVSCHRRLSDSAFLQTGEAFEHAKINIS